MALWGSDSEVSLRVWKTTTRLWGRGAEQKQPKASFFSAYHLTAAIPPRSAREGCPAHLHSCPGVAWRWGSWVGRTDDFNLRQNLGRITFHLLIFLSPPPPSLIQSVVEEKGLFPQQHHCKSKKSAPPNRREFQLEEGRH